MVDKGLEAAGTLVLAGSSRCSGVSEEYGMGTKTVGAFTMASRDPEPPATQPHPRLPWAPAARAEGERWGGSPGPAERAHQLLMPFVGT